MNNLDNLNQAILEQVKNGRMEKGLASRLLTELNQSRRSTGGSVAIIGMACRFPGALNPEEYWNNLKNGVCSIGKFPETRRKDTDSYITVARGTNEDPYRPAGYLEEIDQFDPGFFRISPKEALLMEPSQRILLETTYEAFEDAGYGGASIYGSKTGIFIGIDHTNKPDYRGMTGETDFLALTGSWTGILSRRISYIYNLRGPSLVVDCACSSGLVAVHMACRALQNNECQLAIAGGLNLFSFLTDKMEGIESNDDILRAFEKNSQGTIWGEGVGVILLKPLSKAVTDRDQIHAVIRGSSINNDGASNGITAPNAEAQTEVIVKAWEEAQVDPETITYIEAHGTGTALGDPIEIQGITDAFRLYTLKKQFCGIGSVKTNIGHLVGTSGISSLIKVVLAMKKRALPASLNFQEPNRYINFGDSPVYVNDLFRKWESDQAPRRAGVNAFGFSGTNCHILLEEGAEDHQAAGTARKAPLVITFSAKSKTVLKKLVQKYQEFIEKESHLELEDICYTANTGRGHYSHRLGLLIADQDDLREKLAKLNRGEWEEIKEDGIFYGEHKVAGLAEMTGEKGVLTENGKREVSQTVNLKIKEIFQAREEGKAPLLKELLELYVRGVDIQWNEFYQNEFRKKVSLPVYPYEHQRYWFEAPSIAREDSPGRKKLKKVKLKGRSEDVFTPLEEQIGQIWGEAFGLTELNINVDLYELGGDSIIAIKIISLINQYLGKKVELDEVLKYPTIAQFAAYLSQNNPELNEQTARAVESPVKKERAPAPSKFLPIREPNFTGFWIDCNNHRIFQLVNLVNGQNVHSLNEYCLSMLPYQPFYEELDAGSFLNGEQFREIRCIRKEPYFEQILEFLRSELGLQFTVQKGEDPVGEIISTIEGGLPVILLNPAGSSGPDQPDYVDHAEMFVGYDLEKKELISLSGEYGEKFKAIPFESFRQKPDSDRRFYYLALTGLSFSKPDYRKYWQDYLHHPPFLESGPGTGIDAFRSWLDKYQTRLLPGLDQIKIELEGVNVTIGSEIATHKEFEYFLGEKIFQTEPSGGLEDYLKLLRGVISKERNLCKILRKQILAGESNVSEINTNIVYCLTKLYELEKTLREGFAKLEEPTVLEG